MSEPPIDLWRRQWLKWGAASLTLAVTGVGRAASAVSIVAVRVWPASDYTRVTLECDRQVAFSHQLLKNPDRLMVDLEGVEFNSVISSLPEKIVASDPYIMRIRAGRNRPGVVRLVIELKQEVQPEVFTLKPAGDYGDRLVLDLFPLSPPDPLMTLLGEKRTTAQTKPDNPQANPEKSAKEDKPQKEEKAAKESPAAKEEKMPAMSQLAIIMLDPGHGGEDPGAIGYRGSKEKMVTLQIARRLRERIRAESNFRVALTRDDDFFVPLGKRVSKARAVQADLFVSIHADAFLKPTARGSSVFVLSDGGATSAAARWLANKENAADRIGGVDLNGKDAHLARTLLDLSQTATRNDSLKLANAVLRRIGRINELHKNGVEQAGFAVLKAPDIPSILVETAFISNPEEEARLNDENYQDQMAEAIFSGICQYLVKNPPLQKSKIARFE